MYGVMWMRRACDGAAAVGGGRDGRADCPVDVHVHVRVVMACDVM